MAASGDTATFAAGAHTAETLASDRLRELIRQAIEETAARGDVVIVAHAASHALASTPGVLRVLVTASPETRRERVAAERGVDSREAARAVDAGDAARADYLRKFYGVEAGAADRLRRRRRHRPAHDRAGRVADRRRGRPLTRAERHLAPWLAASSPARSSGGWSRPLR